MRILDDINGGATNYGYTPAPQKDLGATEFTLVEVVTDVSASVGPFKAEMEKCLGRIVAACNRSPRKLNLLQRVTTFNTRISELHGYKLLSNIAATDYDGKLRCGGGTAFFDGVENAVLAINDQGKTLTDQDMNVNGILIAITDGEDNSSTSTIHSCRKALEGTVKSEKLESLLSICICVNSKSPSSNDYTKTVGEYLEKVAKDCGFTQYVAVDDASEETLAKIAEFISKSISAMSQALGTGGASKPIDPSLTF